MAQESILATERGRKNRSLREIADTKHRVSAPGGVKFGRKPKLSLEQIEHAREQIDKGKRREDIAALMNVDRTTLYRALVVP
jgi:hypothetical protein